MAFVCFNIFVNYKGKYIVRYIYYNIESVKILRIFLKRIISKSISFNNIEKMNYIRDSFKLKQSPQPFLQNNEENLITKVNIVFIYLVLGLLSFQIT